MKTMEVNVPLDPTEKRITRSIRIQPGLIKCLQLEAIQQGTTSAKVLQDILYEHYHNKDTHQKA